METNETIHGEFKRLDGERTTRLDASEQFAYYTIPSVFPRQPASDSDQSIGMIDSIGSAVVNHFANKLVTTLFSPNRPFFRLMPDFMAPEVKALREAQEGDDVAAQEEAQNAFDDLRSKFVTVEKDAVSYLERIGYRTAATNAAKLLIVTGDVVMRSTPNKKTAVYSMRDYVAVKDLTGDDVTLIVRDNLVYGSLTEDQQVAVRASGDGAKDYVASTKVDIYTKCDLMNDGRYEITQAIDNYDIPVLERNLVKKDDLPFAHLSWNLIKGENYGRGLVEDFSGSFHMIDNMTNAQSQIAAKMADMKIMVDPASGIDVEALNSSDSGTYISGKPTGVQALATGLENGIQHIMLILEVHKRQISAAFLYQTGQTRDAERVTAEEIRENAAELEIAHGGVYSRFASDWQAKVAREAVSALGEDLGDVVEPQIMTGMDSLSRTGEMQAVRIWMNDLSMLNTVPEDVRVWLEGGKFAEYTAIQRGVDHGAFIKTEEKRAAEVQAEQEAAMAAQAAQTGTQVQAEAAKTAMK